MHVKYSLILFYIAGIILLYFTGRLFLGHMKIIAKIFINIILGFILLLAVNFVGGTFFEYHISLNAFSVMITGFLGVPGVVLLMVLKFIYTG